MKARIDDGERGSTILALIAIIVGILGAYGLVVAITGTETISFEEFAMDQQTQSYFASDSGYPIHCSKVAELQPMLDGWRARGERPVILWMGNSQVHAINQIEPGQENAAPILYRYFSQFGLDFLTFSFPNANFQEKYVVAEHIRRLFPIKALVVALVYDDLRETGIRDDFTPLLTDPELRDRLKSTAIGNEIINQSRAQAAVDNRDMAGVRGTLQERSEAFLDAWLSDHCVLWKMRVQARGRLETGIYMLRNSVFGITAQSKRKKIAGRYELNMKALEALTQGAQKDGTEVLLYIAPLRKDVETPYVASEYEAFKIEAADLAKRTGARFENLEDLVPGAYWGSQGGTHIGGKLELDFMHFTSAGHALLAPALEKMLANRIPKGKQ